MKRLRSRARGMILVTTLLLSVVLLMFVGASLATSKQGRYSSTRYAQQVGALYAAEAGLQEIVQQLQDDVNWAPASYQGTLSNGKGSYSIQFGSGPNGSVNNLKGLSALDGPRGAGTVPPASAYLVISGSSGGVERKLEVVVKSAPFNQLRSPLVSDGPIDLYGNVEVSGIKSFTDLTPVDADIHTNITGDLDDTITWHSGSGDILTVSGIVSSCSTSADAVTLDAGPGTYTVQGEPSGAGSRPFPKIDVEKEISTAKNLTAFTPSVGLNVLSGGDYSYSGGTIHGDLVLQDVRLYVDGPLTVNGSITGDGSIFVKGNTTFSGASEVNVTEGYVSLYSQGHVKLDGFGGTAF